jgi:anhydro-N-acetylmuramic acid kinase
LSQIKSYQVVGLMSGSSLDGLDLCYVRIKIYDLRFEYEILAVDCVEYSADFKSKLRNAPVGSAFELAPLHTELGKYFGNRTRELIDNHNLDKPDLVVSHGQTIFHQPQKGFTTQIGCGAQIAAQTNCKTVCDLRSTDVAYGGQGAPIVPVAEKYLFPEYNCFLNLGGIANISFHMDDGCVLAYDVCAANTLLNHLALQKGLELDKDGCLARSGEIHAGLLNELNNISFYQHAPPRSLGTEHILEDWFPLFNKYHISIEDKMATAVEHIAMMVGNEINSKFKIPRLPDGQENSKLFITGGGALNIFLIGRIRHFSPIEVVVPDEKTVKYKEALSMAFIGLLRYLEIPNVLSSVTGASKNSIGGAVYLP